MKKNNKLKYCPCGAKPTELCLTPGSSLKWAHATCNKCDVWSVEFFTGYKKLDSEQAMQAAVDEWNLAPETPRSWWNVTPKAIK